MKNKIIIAVSWVLVIFSMVIIFAFSSEDSNKSAQTSGTVTDVVLKPVAPEHKTPELVKKVNFSVRKLAHFSAFAMLGFFTVNAFNMTFKKRLFIFSIISFFTTVLYAVFDEIHQKFVSGRVMSIKDVIIDSCGAIFGILLYLLILLIIKKVKNRKKKI